MVCSGVLSFCWVIASEFTGQFIFVEFDLIWRKICVEVVYAICVNITSLRFIQQQPRPAKLTQNVKLNSRS